MAATRGIINLAIAIVALCAIVVFFPVTRKASELRWPDETWGAFATVARAIEQYLWESGRMPTNDSALRQVIENYPQKVPQELSYSWSVTDENGRTTVLVTAHGRSGEWTESFEIITPPYESKPDVLFIHRAGKEVLADSEENVSDALASDVSFFKDRNGQFPKTVSEAVVAANALSTMPLVTKYGLTFKATEKTIIVKAASGNSYTYTYDSFGIRTVIFDSGE